jgi:hypothetical protein
MAHGALAVKNDNIESFAVNVNLDVHGRVAALLAAQRHGRRANCACSDAGYWPLALARVVCGRDSKGGESRKVI